MLMFGNLGGALSVKTCYAKFLNSSAVFFIGKHNCSRVSD